jgi:hypothetical protein
MASFLINTKAEFLKCRKTAAYFIAIGAGLLVPFINALSYIIRPDLFKQFQQNPWHTHINNNWQPTAAFLLPTFVIMLTSLMVQIEYRNNTWKQVYTSPRSYADIFFSKFLIIHLLVLGSMALFNISILLSGYVANMIHGSYGFFSEPVPWSDLLRISAQMYASILGLTAIQYWLSLRLKNYIAPLGIGIGLLFTGLIIIQWDKVVYYPYAYSALTFFKGFNKGGKTHLLYSYIWFAGIMLLAFWDTIKRKERG